MIPLLLSALLVVVGSAQSGAPQTGPGFSFGLPFEWHAEGSTDVWYLADNYPPGLDVVLVGDNGTWHAKTGTACKIEYGGQGEVEATRLTGIEKSPPSADIAVVAAQAPSVRVVKPEEGRPFLTKEMEAQAEQLLDPTFTELEEIGADTKSKRPAKVMRAGRALLLVYDVDRSFADGIPVLFLNGHVFKLGGLCTCDHLFFTVNGKLHLAYGVPSCNSGAFFVTVYDLSGTEPKHVYDNWALGT
ncbi:MAG: hypothetical protein AB1646_00275 [Thermodesulfobacteriota bacterium]